MLYFLQIGFCCSPNLISQLSGMLILPLDLPVPSPWKLLPSESLLIGFAGPPVALDWGFGVVGLDVGEGMGMM